MFLQHNIDEMLIARATADLSFRNPVERCHAVTNQDLQIISVIQISK